MKIKRLYVNNYKSLVDFELLEPNPFSVFVGPNAAGKSNVFEALEFLSYAKDLNLADMLFEGAKNYLNKKLSNIVINNDNAFDVDILNLTIDETSFVPGGTFYIQSEEISPLMVNMGLNEIGGEDYQDFYRRVEERYKWYNRVFSRVFVKLGKARIDSNGPGKLRIDAANLEPVLHRILQNDIKRDEITEWIEYLIPGLEKVDVVKSEYSDDYVLQIFEKHLPGNLSKKLISDGTYNILALLTAVYQSDEPQFLCIEEPENGITPYVQRALVNFFRTACEEKGHYIWLNTHSPTIVNELQPKELILIDKVEGITKAKQLDPNLDFKTMKLDEAWLTNTLGGGLPW